MRLPRRCAKANVAQRRQSKGRWPKIAAGNGAINAFTAVTKDRALAEAAALDAERAACGRAGPLAGVHVRGQKPV